MHPPIRLPDKTPYEVPGYAVHVWFGPDDRSKRTFANPRAAHLAVNVLKQQAELTAVPIFIHVLRDARSRASRPVVVADVHRSELHRPLQELHAQGAEGRKDHGLSWQDRFGDRVIREGEGALDVVCRYVLENAAKDGLVESWREYPFCGSLVVELE